MRCASRALFTVVPMTLSTLVAIAGTNRTFTALRLASPQKEQPTPPRTQSGGRICYVLWARPQM